MNTASSDLLDEFRRELENKRQSAIIDAYINKPSPDAMAAKALEMLDKDLDAIDEP